MSNQLKTVQDMLEKHRNGDEDVVTRLVFFSDGMFLVEAFSETNLTEIEIIHRGFGIGELMTYAKDQVRK